MRLDRVLKYSGLFPQRYIAKFFCDNNQVYVNGQIRKPTFKVKDMDVVKVVFGSKVIEFYYHEKLEENTYKIGFELIEGSCDA